MKNKKMMIYILGFILIVIFGIGLYFYLTESNNNILNLDKIMSSTQVAVIDEDDDIDWSKYDSKEITLNDESITITEAGVYTLSGKISNGSVTVNTDGNVKLILNNVTITNNSGPSIIILNAKNTVIELADNTVNTLTDGKTYTNSEYDGCIYSKDDLIIGGNGKLIINANYQDGIVSNDDLKITSGTYEINTVDDGIRGKDSVYIVNGTFKITAGGDAIKATNDTDTDKGNIKIDNGTFKIVANNDGVQAEKKLIIQNGTFDITSGGGSTGTVTKQFDTNKTNSNESNKGLKTGDNLVIYNGTFTINSKDDGIHSNGALVINNGEFTIASSDDAIHADSLLEINDGSFEITAAEGLEATYVKINEGVVNINATDDGINAGKKSNDYTPTIEINGGELTIKMGQGDTDGIDSNGNIYINGGTINITATSPFDYDGEAKYTGGKLIVNGTETTTITNQMMGGGMMPSGNQGGMPQDGNMNNHGRTGRRGMNRRQN